MDTITLSNRNDALVSLTAKLEADLLCIRVIRGHLSGDNYEP